ncbi:MAG: putative sulfate exporter family transporter [Methylocystis sp.]|nr:putative sulfate exporter family transporter [Methylocystis sp.]MCA3582288.1 putative sulfate exporter family transporter [Methylocystis sp.]MCA3588183.1 putative sulfate exporter family transporter [Methylocystis sp.]MCA3590101.1 putative sulfate exporter family transporter [Methylocystis sp.]
MTGSASTFISKNGAGILLSAAVAVAAVFAEPLMKQLTGGFSIPAMVIALFFGIALNGLASEPRFQPGITWCVKKLLRIAIGLLGLRIALGDILGLGIGAIVLVVASMALTIAASIWLARQFGLEAGYGALAGAANAVCGASATLATNTVVPNYKTKDADTAFTVVMANAISTLVMLAYPPLCLWLGLSSRETGIMLGATIHDMAQVVGAGYALSEDVGNTAVVVKLFRVFLLLPVVLAIGWWFTRSGAKTGEAKVPAPVFAVVFLALALLNTAAVAMPSIQPLYLPVKTLLNEVSRWGLLLSIAALGLGTSVSAILAVGWRHVAVFLLATILILAIVTVGIMLLR